VSQKRLETIAVAADVTIMQLCRTGNGMTVS
jgi:hypothetical protein